jgi:hypothetical protein
LMFVSDMHRADTPKSALSARRLVKKLRQRGFWSIIRNVKFWSICSGLCPHVSSSSNWGLWAVRNGFVSKRVFWEGGFSHFPFLFFFPASSASCGARFLTSLAFLAAALLLCLRFFCFGRRLGGGGAPGFVLLWPSVKNVACCVAIGTCGDSRWILHCLVLCFRWVGCTSLILLRRLCQGIICKGHNEIVKL